MGFMIAEGTTLAICAGVYLYLRRNFESWPPLRTPPPDLLIPTIAVVVLVASTAIAVMIERNAKAFDIARTRRWKLIGVGADIVMVTLRALEFNSLNTRWDNDAYGSIVWFTIGFHSTLLLLVLIEDLFIAATFVKGPLERKHFSDAADAALYWYFVAGAWVPLYVLLYLGPRFM